MNQLETNLALWAICSILLFEILIIICLCRCCFNRIRPKKFYVKREEYQYLSDTFTNNRGKYPSTILRPPHADELALVGTIRGQKSLVNHRNGFHNMGYLPDYDTERIARAQPPASWIELQPNVIRTAQLPPADYEIRTYPAGDYYCTQPHSLEVDESSDETSDFTNFRFQPLRRPELLLPQAQRVDTATEFYGIAASNTIPKSILKMGTGTTPPLDMMSTIYAQTARSRTPSKYDDVPLTLLFPPGHRMRFASLDELNDIEWEVPREFQPSNRNDSRSPSTITASKPPRSWSRELTLPWESDTVPQQAFEY